MDDTAIRRIMPHDSAAEESVVGSMLFDKEAIDLAGELLLKEDFYEKQNLRKIYEKLQKEIKALDDQREEFIGALETADDENAFNYLSKKADELYAKIKNLSQETTRVAENMQAVYKEYAAIRAKIKAAQVQYAENVKVYNQLKASKQDERDKIESKLKEIEKGVDPALMAKYKDKRAKKMFPIIKEVQGDFCGACSMELPKSTLARLKSGEVIECDNCGRLLFLKK